MKYRSLSGYKYQVAEEERIPVPLLADVNIETPHFSIKGGVMTARAGYCWDGPSGPTFDTANSMTPSLAHDIGYQAIRMGLLDEARREDLDYELDRLSRERGMSKLRRLVWFNGLSLFGFNASKLRKEEPQDVILIAP